MSETRKLFAAWLALMLLLALTVGSAFVELGAFNAAINLAIAAAKAGIIASLFMQLFGHSMLPRLAVIATGLWLLFLFGLTLID